MPGHHLIAQQATIVALIVGVLLLLWGRRLFWLVLGVAGFLFASSLLLGETRAEPAATRLVLALLAGVIGIVIAILAQKVAVAIAGFLLGAGTVAGLLGWSTSHPSAGEALVLIVCGVVAALLALWLFDLALIVLSSLAGSGLILDALHQRGANRLIFFVILLAIGIAVQSMWLRPARA